jgi:hypothetical protein
MCSQPVISLPLSPTLPWTGPSDEYVFYEGPMELVGLDHGADVAPGRVVLVVRAGTSLHWDALIDAARPESQAWRYRSGGEAVELRLRIDGRDEVVRATITGNARGFLPGDRDWSISAPSCARVAATQFGLPHLFAGEWLQSPQHSGTYRTQLEFEGWVVTLDERNDHSDVFADATRRRLPVATHAFELRRSDDAQFSAVEADDVLTGWDLGLSFAMDRWCPPVFARGFGADHQICWTEWLPLMVDPPNRGSLRWWSTTRFDDLEEFMRCWMRQWIARDERQARRFLISSALAAGESALLEQRLSTRAAALELFWVFAADRLGASMAQDLSGRDGPACRKLRGLLDAACIDTAIPGHCSALRAYADGNAGEHGMFDGPRVMTFVRNRLAHPNQTEQLYAADGLIIEAALLAGRYLDLLLLRELGYRGRVTDRTKPRRWSGETDAVPWFDASAADTVSGGG